jgi:hypothetical protein
VNRKELKELNESILSLNIAAGEVSKAQSSVESVKSITGLRDATIRLARKKEDYFAKNNSFWQLVNKAKTSQENPF